MKTKAQSGMEFMIISATVLLFFTLIFLSIQRNVSEKQKEQEIIVVENLALSVQEEISIALSASEGYSREFIVPEKIFGKDYEIQIVDNSTIYVKSPITLSTGKINGDILKGINIIKKENGKVYLN